MASVLKILVGPAGFEPAIRRLWVVSSNHWAMGPSETAGFDCDGLDASKLSIGRYHDYFTLRSENYWCGYLCVNNPCASNVVYVFTVCIISTVRSFIWNDYRCDLHSVRSKIWYPHTDSNRDHDLIRVWTGIIRLQWPLCYRGLKIYGGGAEYGSRVLQKFLNFCSRIQKHPHFFELSLTFHSHWNMTQRERFFDFQWTKLHHKWWNLLVFASLTHLAKLKKSSIVWMIMSQRRLVPSTQLFSKSLKS